VSTQVTAIEPKNKGNEVRWNGWGFADTAFVVNDEGVVQLSGSRYLFSGKRFPMMRAWAEEAAGLKLDVETPSQVCYRSCAPISSTLILFCFLFIYLFLDSYQCSSTDCQRCVC
jgi:hypothetical protein